MEPSATFSGPDTTHGGGTQAGGAPLPPPVERRVGVEPNSVREESAWSRWVRHVWLVYLVLFALPLFLQPTSGWQWAVNGAALAVFFWLYGLAHRAGGAVLVSSIGGIFGLGVALLPINLGGMCFFMYAVAFLDRVRRPAVASVSLAILVAVAAAAILRFGSVPMLGMLVLMLLVGVTRIHDGVVERKNHELRLSRDEIEQLAALAERERIGRDLHDLLGHTLSVIVLKSELAAKVAEADPERCVAEIREVERISRETLADVRTAISGYRAPASGLTAELDTLGGAGGSGSRCRRPRTG